MPEPTTQQEREAFVAEYLKLDPVGGRREALFAWAGVAGSMWQAARSLPPTDAQIAAALAAWFCDDGNGTFEGRMRAAIDAALAQQEGGSK